MVVNFFEFVENESRNLCTIKKLLQIICSKNHINMAKEKVQNFLRLYPNSLSLSNNIDTYERYVICIFKIKMCMYLKLLICLKITITSPQKNIKLLHLILQHYCLL